MRTQVSLATIVLLLCLSALSSSAQTEQTDSTTWYKRIASRIFLPSLDVGYLYPNSSILEGSVTIKTAVEYRIRNNNDLFIRLSYDTYGAVYKLESENGTTNTIEGNAQFTDLFLAPGYRFGDQKLRVMFTFMPGVKFYEFPTATVDGASVVVSAKRKSVFTTSAFTTAEYYFDEKSAITLSLFQNQVWRKVDFWKDGGAAYGISVGFITSLL